MDGGQPGAPSVPTLKAATNPRIVAVASTIPIHGALVFLQMSSPDCEDGDGEEVGDENSLHSVHSNSIQQYRICQAVIDADIQWCATKMTTPRTSLRPLQQSRLLSQHAAFSPSKTIPLCTNILTAYANANSLPKRFLHGNLPIKVRDAAGDELSINWPFVRGPNQGKEDFENAIKDILIVNIGPSVNPSSLLGCNLLTSIVNKDLGDYEVAVALESHRVFQFDCPPEEGSSTDESNSHNQNTSSSSSFSPALPSSVIIPKDVESSADDVCNGDGNTASLLTHFGSKLDDPTMEYFLRGEEDNAGGGQPSSCKRDTTGTTCAGGQKRSIHDILMGDDSDSDEGCDREPMNEMLLRKENCYYLNSYVDGEYYQEYHHHNQKAVDGSGGDGSGNCGDKANFNSREQEHLMHDANNGGNARQSGSGGGACVAGGRLLQGTKAEIAAQICFAEWEADRFFAKISGTNVKLHIVKCNSNTKSGDDDPNDETGEL